jgi:mannose-6-phosphate isomerase
VLAADAPLSLQAHPTMAQARAGFAAEEAAGVPQDDPTRTFKDPWHKPELLLALTTFEALCGFRPVEESLHCLAKLQLPRAQADDRRSRPRRAAGGHPAADRACSGRRRTSLVRGRRRPGGLLRRRARPGVHQHLPLGGDARRDLPG